MASCARREIVRPDSAGIYHCWSRCVRRAWLMGKDRYTGIDYSHRRKWILERLRLLVRCFAIDVGFYATLASHLHLVLRTNPHLVKRWGSHEVARRWLRAYPGRRVLNEEWVEPTEEQVAALARDKKKIKKLRKRLANLSWFMGSLSEYIARRANIEDNVTGRFWQGRFGCREITDESALLVCGAYVDLNLVRAGESLTPSEAWYSSIGLRMSAGEEGVSWLAPLTLSEDDLGDQPSETGARASDKGLLSLSLEEYVALLQWTATQVQQEQSDAVPPSAASILERLGICANAWVEIVRHFPSRFRRMAGRAATMTERASAVGRRWFHGCRTAAEVFH